MAVKRLQTSNKMDREQTLITNCFGDPFSLSNHDASNGAQHWCGSGCRHKTTPVNSSVGEIVIKDMDKCGSHLPWCLPSLPLTLEQHEQGMECDWRIVRCHCGQAYHLNCLSTWLSVESYCRNCNDDIDIKEDSSGGHRIIRYTGEHVHV